jgi:hypothetical protein
VLILTNTKACNCQGGQFWDLCDQMSVQLARCYRGDIALAENSPDHHCALDGNNSMGPDWSKTEI